MHECSLVLPNVNKYYIVIAYSLELPVAYILGNATNWLCSLSL